MSRRGREVARASAHSKDTTSSDRGMVRAELFYLPNGVIHKKASLEVTGFFLHVIDHVPYR